MVRRIILVVAYVVAFLSTAGVHEVHAHPSTPAPFDVPPPPSKEQVDTALERLKSARGKASGAERAKIDRSIAQLEAYKDSGYDAKEMLRRQKEARKQTAQKTARPAPGSALRPPLKGGTFQPSGTKRR